MTTAQTETLDLDRVARGAAPPQALVRSRSGSRRWPASLAALGAIAIALGWPQRPGAQTLACGDPAPRSWRFRWTAPPVGFIAAGYALVRTPAVSGAQSERIPIASPTTGTDGVILAEVGGFDPMLAWDVAVVAVNAEGTDSARSNALTIAAQISGECAPPAPTLLDYSAAVASRAAELEREAGELRQSAQDLHERLQREVESR